MFSSKKQFLFTLLTTGLFAVASAQVGIGTNSPDASAALEVSATDKGILIPRMSSSQRNGIASPAQGLMVFDNDTKSFWTAIDGVWVEDQPGAGKFIDGASPNIAFYQDKVGIGINNFGDPHKLYVSGIKSNDNPNTTVRIDATYEGSGTSTSTYAMGAVARNNSTSMVNFAIATQGILENIAGGTINTGVGTWPQIANSGTLGYAAGLIAETRNNNSGDMTTVRGMDIAITNGSSATMGQPSLGSMFFTNNGTITGDGYGLFIGGQGSGSVGGDAYALYIATPFSNVAGNSYAIYSENQSNSYIEGNLGVGTDDPQQKAHINGVLRLEPQSTPPAGELGDLYVSDGGSLFFHNGTDWQEVQLAP